MAEQNKTTEKTESNSLAKPKKVYENVKDKVGEMQMKMQGAPIKQVNVNPVKV